VRVAARPDPARPRITALNEIVRDSGTRPSGPAGDLASRSRDEDGDQQDSAQQQLADEDLADPVAAVHHYAERRNEFYRAAANAFRQGMASYAGELAQRGKRQHHLMKLARIEVVRRCLQLNPNSNVLSRDFESPAARASSSAADRLGGIEQQLRLSRQTHVDLHGLQVPEALQLLRSLIQKALARSDRQPVCLTVITGVGHHSVRGRGKLREAVRHLLSSNGHVFSEPQDGQFKVQL